MVQADEQFDKTIKQAILPAIRLELGLEPKFSPGQRVTEKIDATMGRYSAEHGYRPDLKTAVWVQRLLGNFEYAMRIMSEA